MLLDFLVFLYTAIFGGWLFSQIINGIRTGHIRHSDSRSTFSRRQQPVRFFLVVFLFVAFAGMHLYVAILRALAIWHNLSA